MSIEELLTNPTEDLYLVVDAYEPEADILVKKWRVRCRERHIPSVVIVRNGTEFIVEVRQLWMKDWAIPSFSEFSDFPAFDEGGAGGCPAGIHFTVRQPQDPALIADIVFFILKSLSSEERRLASARDVSPLAEPESNIPITVTRCTYPALPPLRFVLPKMEYDVLSAVLKHFPANDGHKLWYCSGSLHNCKDFEARLPMVKKSLWADFKAKAGRFIWETRFDIEVEMVERFEPWYRGSPDVAFLSRPGISGNTALVRVELPKFQGYVVLRKSQIWRVDYLSFDEDWQLTQFEEWPKDDFSLKVLEYDHWRNCGLPFPVPDTSFYHPWDLKKSDSLYRILSEGTAPPEMLELEFVPILGGRRLSIGQFLILAQDRGEFYYDCQESELAVAARSAGKLVVNFGEDSSPGLGKFLAYVSERLDCMFLRESFAIRGDTSEKDKKHLNLLAAILERAGFPGIDCGLTDDGVGDRCYFQDKGSQLAERLYESPAGRTGTLVLTRNSFFWFNSSPFRTIRELSRILSFSLEEVKALWHATGVETAWRGQHLH